MRERERERARRRGRRSESFARKKSSIKLASPSTRLLGALPFCASRASPRIRMSAIVLIRERASRICPALAENSRCDHGSAASFIERLHLAAGPSRLLTRFPGGRGSFDSGLPSFLCAVAATSGSGSTACVRFGRKTEVRGGLGRRKEKTGVELRSSRRRRRRRREKRRRWEFPQSALLRAAPEASR